MLKKAHLSQFLPVCETILIIAGLYAMLKWLPRRIFIDGDVRLLAIYNLVHHGQMPNMGYSIVGPAFSIPLLYVDEFRHTLYSWQKDYNVFLLAASILLAYILLRKKVDQSLLRKFFLVLIVASMFGNNITYYGGEMFTALGVGFGVLVMLLGPSLAGWGAIVLGVVNTPATLVGLGAVILRRILTTRRLHYALVLVITVGLILAEAWIRRGSPLDSGYGNQKFSTPFFFGLISILFSFGKGLIFFTPGLLLPVKKSILQSEHKNRAQLYEAYLLWMCFLIGMILVYAQWWAWDGGWFWGPRFFVFACVPASFALAVRLHNPAGSFRANLLTLLVLVLSLWVGFDGAIFDQGGLAAICVVNNFSQNYLCQYHPMFSALWRPFVTHYSLNNQAKLYLAYTLIVAAYLSLLLLKVMAVQARDWFEKVLSRLRGTQDPAISGEGDLVYTSTDIATAPPPPRHSVARPLPPPRRPSS